MNFSDHLLSWYDGNGRKLPWRTTRNPYLVWVSEIILQQTRMEQGLVYYSRFTEVFPDVYALANASEHQVLRAWQGFGYYSRARHLHRAARQIVDDFGGVFPETSREWIRLKGVGPYTAAAIASIAFDEAVPAIDGNVIRILARLYAIRQNMDTSAGKKVFYDLAMRLLPDLRAGDFNQAMMDFGSLVCKPVRPDCQDCIFQFQCKAFRQGVVGQYPLRRRKKPVRVRHFNYFCFYTDDPQDGVSFFIQQRKGNDIWKSLYEFPLLETKHNTPVEELTAHPWLKALFRDDTVSVPEHDGVTLKHQLTHQRICARFFRIRLYDSLKEKLMQQYLFVNRETFDSLPKSRLIEGFLKKWLTRH